MANYRTLRAGSIYMLNNMCFTMRIWSNVTNEEMEPLGSGDKLVLVRVVFDDELPKSPYTNFIVLMGMNGIEFNAPLNLSEFMEEI